MDRKLLGHGSARVSFKDEASGSISVVFSTLNVIDKDGDVTLPGAFANGARVNLAAFGHNWGTWPWGDAVIRANDIEAIADGAAYLSTPQGSQAYKTLKERHDRAMPQEWSYGFDVLDAEFGTFNGQNVRFLKRLQVHEVSPVLLGAGEDTRTLDVKQSGKAEWTTAYINDLPDSAFAYIEPGGEKDEEGKTTPRSKRHFPHHNADGEIDLPHVRNALARIPQSTVPEAAQQRATAHVQRHLDASKADAAHEPDIEPLRSLFVELKEGRVLSAATRARLEKHPDALRQLATEIEALLEETATPKRASGAELYGQFLAIQARAIGVAV
jgi:hypothetical protein